MVLFGISLIWYHTQLKRQKNAIMQKNVAQPNSKILPKTVNSEVVIAISVFYCIPNLHELWVEFWRGKHQTVE